MFGCLETTIKVLVEWMPVSIPRTTVFWLLTCMITGSYVQLYAARSLEWRCKASCRHNTVDMY